MVNIEQAPIIEARYSPLNPPDFKFIVHAKSAQYFGKLNGEKMAEWIEKKVNIPKNEIKTHA